MTALLQQAALLLTAVGVLLALATSAATRRILAGLPVLLDFLLAAALLRMALLDSWVAIATVAVIVVVRKAAAAGIGVAALARATGR